MRTSDFDYNLPEELIAQAPAEPRDSCRLLVLHKDDGSVEHRRFFELGEYLEPGDLLVANRTRVLPARLIGKKPTGGVAETLLLRRREDLDAMGGTWECLVHPGKRLRVGARIEYRAGGLLAPQGAKVVLVAQILDFVEGSRGGRLVRFEPQDGLTLDAAIHAVGNVPLPPYITSYEGDPEKYQTVYAMQEEHSAAAPTAGLHFTPELLGSLREAGVGWAEVELEVGIDTFRLVEEDDPTQHVIHTERYHVSPQVVEAVRATKEAGHRVIAVGTTSVRSLESAWDEEAGCLVARENATTNLFLMPGSAFHVVDAMITNFHVPRSTLMMLVSAFATREYIMAAYEQAIANRYRMLSFGDAMLIV
ncbi:MAG: tRNA preQ1(34) S-adenosylmethionine ribosyltransferase-isomerase QueA [Coriobacteriales bacterium]|nr:tRNA preQ1(34) S-adenosylmethionine ribosyltransferase-isomerase QueA [Coriobacteriales bacterium]